MKTVGIVVEYNPFHNGHLYHAQKAREAADADVVIAVMSGHFLQRGEPALMNKWARTRMALLNGVDLVVELPYAFSAQKADVFGYGAISTLNALGCHAFCFGSENGKLAPFLDAYYHLQESAHLLNAPIQHYMKRGYSFPRAQALAREALFTDEWTLDLSQPNNILGFHYIQANERIGSPMTPLTIKRQQAGYHDDQLTEGDITSATSIRKALAQDQGSYTAIQKYVPSSVIAEMQDYYRKYHTFHTWEMYWPQLQYRLLTDALPALQEIYEVAEGIEYRLKEASRQAASFSEFMHQVKTKRYTWTRIQRMLVHLLTNTTKAEMEKAAESVQYIRLLGMNRIGQEYIRSIKKKLSIPLISRTAAYKELLALDVKATEVYLQGLRIPSLLDSEFKQPPILWP
ncbi:nucleotidyltransferase [Bacillus xiapuensis]|uniref:nucleotidyltransferase n=1 Tax=Bacillus xiapuensis TaxID=2014075 RepID=UPI000C244C74|nr:nucleotidyltransferase [Bacillus xiapuensis]